MLIASRNSEPTLQRFAPIDGLAVFAYTASVLLLSYQEEGSTINKLAAFALIAVAVFYLLRGSRGFAVPREFLLFAGWLVIAMFSVFFAIDQATGFKKALTLLQIIPLSFALYLLLVWNRSITPLVWSYVVALGVAAAMVALNPESDAGGDRLVGTMGNPNTFGRALLVGIVFLIYLASASRSRMIQLICLPTGGLFFIVLLGTGSRKAMIGVLIVFLLTALLPGGGARRTYARRRIASFVMGLGLLVAAGYYILHSEHYDRIERVVVAVETQDLQEAGTSEKVRLLMYQHGLAVALQNPVLGIGLDNFRHAKFGWLGKSFGSYAHSNYLEIVVSTGFFGFFVYYAAYASMGWRLFRLRRLQMGVTSAALWRALVTLFTILVIYDFAAVSYYEKIPWLVLSTILAGLKILDLRAVEEKMLSEAGESVRS